MKNKIMNKILGLKVFTYSKMIDIVEKEKPEILHFHNRHSLVDIFVKRLSYTPRVVCHYHLKFKEPIVPKCTDMILGVSKSVQEHIVKKIQADKKSSYVLNPISFDLYSATKVEKISSSELRLVFGGEDDERKGYKEVIQALHKLRDMGIKYKLTLCGNKRDVNIDSSLNVEQMGFLSSHDFYKVLQQSDILLFPSHDESFGLTVLEGMFFHIKVVPAFSGGTPEILGEDYPYYCKPKDSDSLVQSIVMLSNLKDDREQELCKFYDDVIRKFEPRRVSKSLEEKYKEVLGFEKN